MKAGTVVNDSKTLDRIVKIAKQEFLERGYRDTSLRGIVRKAGLTTGAFYGYFPDKSSLFDHLVQEPAEKLRQEYKRVHDEFDLLPFDKKLEFIFGEGAVKFFYIDYIYSHIDEFKLIVCCSEGTKYAGYIDTLVEIEMSSTYRYIDELKKAGYKPETVHPDLAHLLTHSFFKGFFEVVAHSMEKEDAVEYIDKLYKFYEAGWLRLLGLGSRGKDEQIPE